jgi:hypothetical protein
MIAARSGRTMHTCARPSTASSCVACTSGCQPEAAPLSDARACRVTTALSPLLGKAFTNLWIRYALSLRAPVPPAQHTLCASSPGHRWSSTNLSRVQHLIRGPGQKTSTSARKPETGSRRLSNAFSDAASLRPKHTNVEYKFAISFLATSFEIAGLFLSNPTSCDGTPFLFIIPRLLSELRLRYVKWARQKLD